MSYGKINEKGVRISPRTHKPVKVYHKRTINGVRYSPRTNKPVRQYVRKNNYDTWNGGSGDIYESGAKRIVTTSNKLYERKFASKYLTVENEERLRNLYEHGAVTGASISKFIDFKTIFNNKPIKSVKRVDKNYAKWFKNNGFENSSTTRGYHSFNEIYTLVTRKGMPIETIKPMLTNEYDYWHIKSAIEQAQKYEEENRALYKYSGEKYGYDWDNELRLMAQEKQHEWNTRNYIRLKKFHETDIYLNDKSKRWILQEYERVLEGRQEQFIYNKEIAVYIKALEHNGWEDLAKELKRVADKVIWKYGSWYVDEIVHALPDIGEFYLTPIGNAYKFKGEEYATNLRNNVISVINTMQSWVDEEPTSFEDSGTPVIDKDEYEE